MVEYKYLPGGEVVLERNKDGTVRAKYRGGMWVKYGVAVAPQAYKELCAKVGGSPTANDVIPVGDLYAKILMEGERPKIVTAFVSQPEEDYSKPRSEPPPTREDPKEKEHQAQPKVSPPPRAPSSEVAEAISLVREIFSEIYNGPKPAPLSDEAWLRLALGMAGKVFLAIWRKR